MSQGRKHLCLGNQLSDELAARFAVSCDQNSEVVMSNICKFWLLEELPKCLVKERHSELDFFWGISWCEEKNIPGFRYTELISLDSSLLFDEFLDNILVSLWVFS